MPQQNPSPSCIQVQELHTKHAEESLKAEKWQFEFKNLKEKFEALVKEKEVMGLVLMVGDFLGLELEVWQQGAVGAQTCQFCYSLGEKKHNGLLWAGAQAVLL